MKKDAISQKIHITVDASKVARCYWCGSLESRNWEIAGDEIYCSKQCQAAAEAGMGLPLAILFLLVGIIGPFLWLENPMLLPIGLIILISSPLCFLNWRMKMNIRQIVPRDSRFNEGASELSVLQNVVQSVKCPNCDGNIDLSEVREDMVYHCEYCGASGKVEILKTNE